MATNRRARMGVCLAWLTVWPAAHSRAAEPATPPEGPFGYTLVETADGEPADVDAFFLNPDCAICHPRQLQEVQGSMHSAAHVDPLYRNLAVIARQEAGEKVYTYCSGCHSPAGVVSALIPATPEDELPHEAKAGVTCDVCHQISQLTGAEGPWQEPGNASFQAAAGTREVRTFGRRSREPCPYRRKARLLREVRILCQLPYRDSPRRWTAD